MPKQEKKRATAGERFVGKVQKHAKAIASVCVLFFSALWLYPDLPRTELLRAIERTSQAVEPRKHTIAVGCNTNLDLVVNAIDLLKALGVNPKDTVKDNADIKSLEQLQETFSYFFKVVGYYVV